MIIVQINITISWHTGKRIPFRFTYTSVNWTDLADTFGSSYSSWSMDQSVEREWTEFIARPAVELILKLHPAKETM